MKEFIIVENGVARLYSILQLRKDKNISLRGNIEDIPESTFAEYNCFWAERDDLPAYDSTTQAPSWGEYYQDEAGAWRREAIISPLSEEKIEAFRLSALEAKKTKINDARDELLAKPVLLNTANGDKYLQVDVAGWTCALLSWVSGELETWICLDNELPGISLSENDLRNVLSHFNTRNSLIKKLARQAKNEVIALYDAGASVNDIAAYPVVLEHQNVGLSIG